jgi:rhamnose utilization protein RhaD (predicted bifunctional aldolase and dehydrogenase)
LGIPCCFIYYVESGIKTGKMKKEISDLVEISRYYGEKKDFTLGGGGNTSWKDQNLLYVKASGFSLATITEEGFAVLERKQLTAIMSRNYSDDAQQREQEVMTDLMNSLSAGSKKLRPSVEASLHDLIRYAYVVHTHPYLINALLCSVDVEIHIRELFDEKVLFVPYTDPGYILSRTVSEKLKDFRETRGFEPNIIFLQNHGVFVGADSIEEIREIYNSIMDTILERINSTIEIGPVDYEGPIEQVIDILSGKLSGDNRFKWNFNTLIAHFTKDAGSLSRIEKPFIPDHIVYCRAFPAIIRKVDRFSIKPESVEETLENYREQHGYDPRVVILEQGPVIAIEKDDNLASLVLDVFLDAMKISFYSNYFGGPHFMDDDQIRFIENWEVENYRRKISAGGS